MVSHHVVRGKPHSGMCQDEGRDQPYVQGTSQPCEVYKSSQSVAWVALQGLTCEKKTKSILAKDTCDHNN